MPKITRPVTRYFGGKFRLRQWIASHIPPRTAYIEPYAGGFSVGMFTGRVGTEVYNDLDEGICNLFRVLRDPAKSAELARRLALTPYARSEFDWSYTDPIDDIDQAHKLAVRSAMGHGGDAATRSCRSGFRVMRRERGKFGSSPAQEWATFPPEIQKFCTRLAGVVIENRPALEIIERFDSPETAIYCDPPYVLDTRSMMQGKARKGHGYRHEMSDADHRDLAATLNNCKSMVVLSGYPSALYDELYEDWQKITCKATIEGGAERTEAIWLNTACSTALIAQAAQQRQQRFQYE